MKHSHAATAAMAAVMLLAVPAPPARGQVRVQKTAPVTQPAPVPVAKAAPLLVMAPAAGEKVAAGSCLLIRWTRGPSVGKAPFPGKAPVPEGRVNLYLVREGKTIHALAEQQPGSGAWGWQVPAALPQGQYVIAVRQAAGGDPVTSGVFNVIPPPPHRPGTAVGVPNVTSHSPAGRGGAGMTITFNGQDLDPCRFTARLGARTLEIVSRSTSRVTARLPGQVMAGDLVVSNGSPANERVLQPGYRVTASPPARPTGLRKVKDGSISHGGSYNFVGLMWSDNAYDETSYVIERWGGPGCEDGYRKVGATRPDGTYFEDIGVDPRAGSYWWVVKACNAWGCSTSVALTLQNDQRNVAVGGTTQVVVPKDPSQKCAEEGGVWLGWGVDYCSHELGDAQSFVQTATNPIVQGYMAYFAVVGGGAEMRSLPEDVIQALKPFYGESLLRDVRYGSSSHTASDGTAMTDCRDIYFPFGSGHVATIKEGALLQKDANGKLVHESTVRLLLHELQHARQCGDIGGRVNYGLRWFSEMSGATIVKLITAPTTVSRRTIHDAMPMEDDAKAKEDLASGL